MPRTIAEKERIAAEIADRLANQDGDARWRDAEPLRRIADADLAKAAGPGPIDDSPLRPPRRERV